MSHAELKNKASVPKQVEVTKDLVTTLDRLKPVKLNRVKLTANGYGQAALDRLEAGFPISYGDANTPADHIVREFPDGKRCLLKIGWLANKKAWRVETVKPLPDALR